MSEGRRTRDPVQTRARILDAAGRALLTHGAGASLEVIARVAEVSKGGLLHHFPSKDALLVALGAHLEAQFEEHVEAQLDPEDDAPGRLLRAYVRASLDQLDATQVREEITLLALISAVPEATQDARDAWHRWRERLAADGLDAGRTHVIVRAADGVSAASLFDGDVDAGEVDALREELLALTRDAGPLPGRPPRPW
ncbi:TetR/AcrR family transcriptional regulator [Nocardioides bruguierae]|uniref:TetR/AcrR family transcriptional regulator n=1 Tax=Nocardioides bruguierae TaxID=2945102 RepID=UPI002020CE54|nr:TetR/AcrR family transcriptional regulator [Nocardioides bruguierae]MCL8026858.1 TetR/AcrR family transcriptional regulator [Nocardioides bruguierae]